MTSFSHTATLTQWACCGIQLSVTLPCHCLPSLCVSIRLPWILCLFHQYLYCCTFIFLFHKSNVLYFWSTFTHSFHLKTLSLSDCVSVCFPEVYHLNCPCIKCHCIDSRAQIKQYFHYWFIWWLSLWLINLTVWTNRFKMSGSWK